MASSRALLAPPKRLLVARCSPAASVRTLAQNCRIILTFSPSDSDRKLACHLHQQKTRPPNDPRGDRRNLHQWSHHPGHQLDRVRQIRAVRGWKDSCCAGDGPQRKRRANLPVRDVYTGSSRLRYQHVPERADHRILFGRWNRVRDGEDRRPCLLPYSYLSSAFGTFAHDAFVPVAAGEPSLARLEYVGPEQKKQQSSCANSTFYSGDQKKRNDRPAACSDRRTTISMPMSTFRSLRFS